MNPPITEEALMAYADGELDAPSRTQVEEAVARDPALAERLRQHQALRTSVRQAFDTELDEPVPERLLKALTAQPAAPRAAEVVSLAAHRSARDTAPPRTEAGGWTWAHWGGLAAAVAFGVLVGRFSGPGAPGVASPTAATPAGFVLQGGRALARGDIQAALTSQAAAAPAAGRSVGVQVSFVDTNGAYCRTFSTAAQAGLACREGPDWAVHLLVDAPPSPGGETRQAASALPPALLAEVDRRIVGAALDAKAEAQALERGWER